MKHTSRHSCYIFNNFICSSAQEPRRVCENSRVSIWLSALRNWLRRNERLFLNAIQQRQRPNLNKVELPMNSACICEQFTKPYHGKAHSYHTQANIGCEQQVSILFSISLLQSHYSEWKSGSNAKFCKVENLYRVLAKGSGWAELITLQKSMIPKCWNKDAPITQKMELTGALYSLKGYI